MSLAVVILFFPAIRLSDINPRSCYLRGLFHNEGTDPFLFSLTMNDIPLRRYLASSVE